MLSLPPSLPPSLLCVSISIYLSFIYQFSFLTPVLYTCHIVLSTIRLPLVKVLMRWNAELKAVYAQYSKAESADFSCVRDCESSNNEYESFTMNVGQFWRFARDSCMVNAGFTLAAMDRCLTAVITAHDRAVSCAKRTKKTSDDGPEDAVGFCPEERSSNIECADTHNSNRAILFREFVEVLVRISYAQCDEATMAETASASGTPSLSSLLSRLLYQHVQKHAGGLTRHTQPSSGRGSTLRKLVDTDTSVRAVIREYDAGLRRVCRSLTRSNGRGSADNSATMRDFLRLFCDSGILGKGTQVPLASAMRFFSRAFQFPIADATDVLSVECIFPDFVDAVVLMAQFMQHEISPLSKAPNTSAQLSSYVRDIATRVIEKNM